MRRNLKKFCCAILCICLLLINVPDSVSYAENMEQNATYTDADTDTTTENADVSVVKEIAQPATATDAEDIDTEAATAGDVLLSATAMVEDELLYAASPDVPEGGYKLEINSQADWDNLFTHTAGDGSGWTSSGGTTATYIENKNPVAIILNADIILSANATLTIPPIDSVSKDFLFYGNGHSIDINGKIFTIQAANTVTIENTHFKNGTVNVQGHISFSCTDSQFSAAAVNLYTTSIAERTYITGCEFSDCPNPCVFSQAAPCPVSFSDCNMNNSGLLFASTNSCRVSFSDITAENCTGPVFGHTSFGAYIIIESISGCELNTSQPGIAAIDCIGDVIVEIKDCEIRGFDTGINLYSCKANSVTDIDTITISDITIMDCITGLRTDYLTGYDNVIISNLTMEARKGFPNSVGYLSNSSRTTKSFSYDTYDFNDLIQIKNCKISGFDKGIDLLACPAFISNCSISDCISGITESSDMVAIVDTTLESRASVSSGSANVGVTADTYFYMIDCDINDFSTGSDLSRATKPTIISCRYQNKKTNLKCHNEITVYDTSFIGGEKSVDMEGMGTLYFYDCVVAGDPSATQIGISMDPSASNTLHMYNLNRPYYSPFDGVYDDLKKYSDRTVNDGKSEIYNCGTGINSTSIVNIADTHVHDCGTGIKSSDRMYSYGNNLIEACTNGMEVQQLYKNETANGITFAETHTDTIRNCSNDGLNGYYITASPAEWKNRLEIYNCGNYGIKNTGIFSSATVDVHDCKTGIYMTETAQNTVLGTESKVYNNQEWNVYDNSTNTSALFIILGSEGTLTGGGNGEIGGNVYMKHNMGTAVIQLQNLYSDDSVYYLGTDSSMYIFEVNNLHGTVVFDTIDSGYTLGRRVAVLSNPDIASQMFAKREGFVISTEKDGSTTYAIFAAGCNVTYDVTANGGDTFDGEKLSDQEIKDGTLTKISYLTGDNIDLTYTASKTGYEFVGWNTDKDATVGLEVDTLTAGTEDITLYAIYKKTADINYHTYDATLDYSTDVTFYNNEDEIECKLAAYNAGGDNTFAGYVLNEDAVVSSDADLLKAGDNVTVSPDGLDVYCVYEKQGQLKYLKKDGTTLSTESKTVYEIGTDNKEFEYTVRAGEPVSGFTFTGWKDEAGNSFAAGATISTMESSIVLTPVYEESTPETPTPEAPTPETPTPGDPVIQPPTTEASTTQAPAGPKTGDSTNPIGVIGLAILSLLGILVLTMKNKRKN